MAIYVPPSTRRRRLVLLVAVGLVVGLLVGYLVGRATARGLDDALADVRNEGEAAAIAFQRIPIEYEQASTGAGGESATTITEAAFFTRTDPSGTVMPSRVSMLPTDCIVNCDDRESPVPSSPTTIP